MSARNLVDLLSRHAPSELQSLRDRYPGSGELLRWDRDLGGEEASVGPDLAPRQELVESGIAAVQARGETIVRVLTSRLRRAQQLKTWGAILAAIANAGLLASLSHIVDLGTSSSQILLAFFAFAASSSTVLAERFGSARVTQLFDEALAISLRATRCEQRRQRLILTVGGVSDWDALLSDVDGVALDLIANETKAKVA